MVEKKTAVLAEIEAMESGAASYLIDLLSEEKQDELAQLVVENKFTSSFLKEKDEVTDESITALYNYAKLTFDTGDYARAIKYLKYFRFLVDPASDMGFSALWGKFAGELILYEWGAAHESRRELEALIESRQSSHMDQLQQRSWLLNWSLFLFFGDMDSLGDMIEMCLKDKYKNAIQTNVPWLLRYLTAAVIFKRRAMHRGGSNHNVARDLVKIIQQEHNTFRDPITTFLESVYVDFDFEQAQIKLGECEELLSTDYFLVFCKDDFMRNARSFIFDTYLRIHQKVELDMLATKMQLKNEAGENDLEQTTRWVEELIQTGLNARIDVEAGTVVMTADHVELYKQVTEATKKLGDKTMSLAQRARDVL